MTFLGMVTNILLTIDNLPGFTFPLISISVLILTKRAISAAAGGFHP
jgi:hypothetical protein